MNFHAFTHGFGDSPDHGERVGTVVGVFQAADDRSGDSDQLGKFGLREPGCFPEFIKFARQLVFGPGLLKLGEAAGFFAVVLAVKDPKNLPRNVLTRPVASQVAATADGCFSGCLGLPICSVFESACRRCSGSSRNHPSVRQSMLSMQGYDGPQRWP